MEKQVIIADKSIIRKIVELEKDAIRQLTIAFLSRHQGNADTSMLSSSIDSYFHEFFLDGTHMQYRVKSLNRLLRFLMYFPIKEKIDMSLTQELYYKHSLINLTTYHISQFTSEPFSPYVIDRFMNYVHGSDIEKICIFYMYRVNPSYVQKHYHVENVDTLSPNELYVGITSGFFSMKNGSCEALKKLFSVSKLSYCEITNYSALSDKSYEEVATKFSESQFLAIKSINKLISEGYYINDSI